ncbi:MAG: sulfurtransferase TusA family protein [Armatimonadetes bacterium]|nr:sulfurtransferase TusA family protein [Armatimonadota bacterium]
MEKIKPDEVLDCLGLFCPIPILKTAAKLKEMKGGKVLEVLTSDSEVEINMPAFCQSSGDEFLGFESLSSEKYRVWVRRRTREKLT